MQFTFRLAAALAAVVLGVPATAAVTPYFDAGSFQAALTGGSYAESFTGVGETPPTAYSNGTFGFGASAPNGLFSASGNDLSTNFADDALTITFTTGNVRGVGGNFFLQDIDGSFVPSNVLYGVAILLSTGEIFDWSPLSESTFLGFVSDSVLTSITFIPYNPNGPTLPHDTGLYATADNLIVGGIARQGNVPEPTSLALAVLGIAGVAARRRRKVA
jgi:hypothetical protein